MSKISKSKAMRRMLEFLDTHKPVGHKPFGNSPSSLVLLTQETPDGRKQVCSGATISSARKNDLVSDNGVQLKLTPTGRSHLQRLRARSSDPQADVFQVQHAPRHKATIKIDGGDHQVVVNSAESPLLRLKNKKSPDGQSWISDAAFVAGERLRADFTRGQMMQKVTANWNAGMGNAGKHSANGKADLSDSALDARDRFYSALDHVGSDLANVLFDVCCFLKGLETVEKERRWPPRSAKLMLRTGLQLLVRYYGIETGTCGRSASTRTWEASENRTTPA